MSDKDHSSADDQELVRKAQKGDMGAFEELVARHRDKIYARALSMMRNEEEAIDLSQEAWVKGWQRLKQFQGESSFGTTGFNPGHTKYPSFRARTTRVSNPVCSPSFRASASVSVQVAAFATGVPPDIYAFHRYTRNSHILSRTQAKQYGMPVPG